MTEIAKLNNNTQLSPANRMKALIENEAVKEMFTQSLGKAAGQFTTSLIELYSDPAGTLKECDAKAVVMEALKAATLNLPLNKNLGFAWVIPYKRKIKQGNNWIEISAPQFQLGYKGYIQLAMRTGQYYTINADVVYDGMEIETDYLTGTIKITGNPKSDEAIGYFAYFKLLNGFEKTIYWTKSQVENHASKFSQGYKSMMKAKSGQYYKPENYVWDVNFDEMALKTLVRRLLSKYGVLSTEMQQAMLDDAENKLEMEVQEKANTVEFEQPKIEQKVEPKEKEVDEVIEMEDIEVPF